MSGGGASTQLFVADFNGDNKADLVVATNNINPSYRGASVLLGNGDGTFTSQPFSGSGANSVAIGDMNGDGKTDIVVGYAGGTTIYLGKGDGTFTAAGSSSAGSIIAVDDVTGDGKLDVIAASNSDGTVGTVYVLLGNGDGTLQTPVSFSTGFNSTSMAVGEFNGDGRTDVAFAEYSSNSVDVLLGVLAPTLNVTSSHSGDFYYAQTGQTYTIIVGNNGPIATSGTVTVTDLLPYPLAATAIAGTGWSCVLSTVTCTRSDSLGVGATYLAITVTITVQYSVSSSGTNQVNASGGGSGLVSAMDPTNSWAFPAPTLLSPSNGATGVSTAPTLSWSPVTGATSYYVFFGTNFSLSLAGSTTATTYSPGPLSTNTTYYWYVVAGTTSTISGASSVQWPFTTQAPAPTGLQFYPVAPCGLVDTRGIAAGFNGIAPFSGPSILAGGTLTIPVQSAAEASANTSPAPCGTIPSTAQAYSLNVTVVPHVVLTDQFPGAVNYLSLWPSGGTQPIVSTLNDGQGEVLANAAIVPAGSPSGGISIYNAGPSTADVILDLNGYFAATTTQGTFTGLRFYPVSPCRLVDTRGISVGFNGISPFSGPSLLSGATANFPVQSSSEATADTTPAPCGTIPSGAQAYSLNTTLVPHAGVSDNFITLWPSGLTQPVVSTLNDGQGEVVANAAIVPAGTPSGGVSVFNQGPATADVILDMNGYFAVLPTGLKFYAVSPCRLVDTRGTASGFNGISPFSGPSIAAGATITIPVQSAAEAAADTTPAPCGTIPSTAEAYSLNVTVVPKVVLTDAYPGAIDYVTIWPAGVTQPIVSTINDQEALVVANAAIVPAGSGSGGVSVYNAGPSATDVILDLNGYFAP